MGRFMDSVRACNGKLCCFKSHHSRNNAAPTGVDELPPTSTAHHEVRPLTLKSFTFHQCLGRGTYGKVVLATHRETKQHMAVKMVKKSSLDSSIFNILAEREVLEMVGDSPFFPHTFGAFQTKDYIFYAMEHVTGGSLEKLMNKLKLNISVTRFISAEIMCGLQVLHAMGVVHRDLKPANILLDSAGHVKIVDFGLSATGVFGSTMLSEYVGTPIYMAPELALQQPYNRMVDYFAFGIIVYQMAYFYNNTLELMVATQKNPPYFPAHMDPDTRDVIEQLLCRDPEMRQSKIENLRQHQFFQKIDWKAMEDRTSCPPFVLQIIPSRTKPSCNIKTEVLMSSCKCLRCLKRMETISDFSFISKRWRDL